MSSTPYDPPSEAASASSPVNAPRGGGYANARPALGSEARTLPARYYQDSELFQREQAAIFSRMWLHAGRSEEIAEPGDYVLRSIGPENIVLLRAEDGSVRAFHNLCRHRGTVILREAQGKLRGKIQCPYHAWTYDYDGCLLAAPLMDKTEGFRRQDFPLHAVQVGEWQGHLFLCLDGRGSSFEQHLDDLPAKLEPWSMGELRRVHRVLYPVAANWKLVLQNYSECVHCPVLHPQLQSLSHYLSGENDPPRPTYMGGRMELRPEVQSLTVDGQSAWSPLPGLGASERRQVAYYILLPNLLLNLHPDYMMTFTLLPRDVGHTDILCEWHFHPDEIAKPGFDPEPATAFWDLTNRQDWEVCELAQRGMASRAYTPGPYSNREEILHSLDRWVLEKLGEGS